MTERMAKDYADSCARHADSYDGENPPSRDDFYAWVEGYEWPAT